MPGNTKLNPFHYVKIAIKMEISSEGGQDTSTYYFCRPFLPCVFQKMPGNLSGWMDFGFVGHLGNGRSVGRMDGRPENMMPPSPKRWGRDIN